MPDILAKFQTTNYTKAKKRQDRLPFTVVCKDNDPGFTIDFLRAGYENLNGSPPIHIKIRDGIPTVLIWNDINSTMPVAISLEKAHVSNQKNRTPQPTAEELQTLVTKAEPLVQGVTVDIPFVPGVSLNCVVFWHLHATYEYEFTEMQFDDEAGVVLATEAQGPNTPIIMAIFEKLLDNHFVDIFEDIIELVMNCDDYAIVQQKLIHVIAMGQRLDAKYPGFDYAAYLREQSF